MWMIHLALEVGGAAVEDGNPPTVPDWHIGIEEAVYLRPPYVIYISDLGILEEPQVQVDLRHAPQV